MLADALDDSPTLWMLADAQDARRRSGCCSQTFRMLAHTLRH